jgi:cytochrome c oxidase assembly protein subunit 15
MAALQNSGRTCTYKPALAIFAAIGSAWVFVLVALGAFTTSIGAGMAFRDWPLSNGSINPEGWLNDIAMFAEHSHRLSGTLMGLIGIGLAFWLHRHESRGWLRQLGWWALALVVIQGLIGGQRVKLDAWQIAGFEMSVGQMLRIPHGILAQVYVCLLIAIAISVSRTWLEPQSGPLSAGVRRAGLLCCVLLFVQLVIAATMRHNYAGLAIQTFPHSTPSGGWLPEIWNFRIGIHFAHRVMAVILSVALLWLVVKLRLDRNVTPLMRVAASLVVALLCAQIVLGAQIILKFREPHVTTGHVVFGALLLATTFWLTWFAHRDVIEQTHRA